MVFQSDIINKLSQTKTVRTLTNKHQCNLESSKALSNVAKTTTRNALVQLREVGRANSAKARNEINAKHL